MIKGINYYKELLKTLSNELTIYILSVLSNRDSYPREIAEILGVDETTVSRKLKKLEKYGIVKSKWIRVEGRNVKTYSLVSDKVIIELSPLQLNITLGNNVVKINTGILLDHVSTNIPVAKDFIDREKELEILKSQEHKAIFIWGLSGIGKSWLVAKYVRDENIPVLWINLSESTTLFNILWKIASFLNKLGRNELFEIMNSKFLLRDDIIDYLSKLEVDAVIVFDGYERIRSFTEVRDFIRNLLCKTRFLKIIVLSRFFDEELENYSNIKIIKLSGFKYSDIKKFFEKHGIDVSDDVVKMIYGLTKGIPLLVNILVNTLKSRDIEVESIRKFYEYGTIKKHFVRKIVDSLSSDERRVIEILSLVDPPIQQSLIEYIYGKKRARDIVNRLFYKGLIELCGDKICLHPILLPYIRDSLGSDYKRKYYRKIGNYYRSKCSTFLCKLNALKYYIRSGSYNLAIELIEDRLKSNKINYAPYSGVYLNLLNEIDLSKVGRKGKVVVYCERGVLERLLGYYNKALYDLGKCIEYALESREQIYVIQALLNKAYIYAETRRFSEAESLVAEAEKLAKPYLGTKLGDSLLYDVYSIRSLLESNKGDYEKALKYVFKELNTLTNVNDPGHYALTMLQLGNLYALVKDYDKALNYLEKAKRVFRFIGNKYFFYLANIVIASTYIYKGDLEDAEKLLKESLKFFSEINDRAWSIRILNSLAMVNLLKNKYINAIDYTNKAIKLDNGSKMHGYFQANVINKLANYMKYNNESLLKQLYKVLEIPYSIIHEKEDALYIVRKVLG